jgi:NADH:ubiquinone oxidoreductase subunit K
VLLNQFLILSAFLFCVGAYGVMVRKHAVLVLMSIELMINSVNMNFIAFSLRNDNVIGHVFALFVIAVAAAEVGVGLAIVLLIYRNKRSVDPGDASEMKG